MEPKRDETIYIYSPLLVQRSVAALKIQSFWRKIIVLKSTKVVDEINKRRAALRIQKWIRGLVFKHRNRLVQNFYFYQKSLNCSTFYLQLMVYMHLPPLMNTLKFNLEHPSKFLPYDDISQYSDLYYLIHKDTKIKTIHMYDQTWLKIEFPSISEATKRIKLIRILSYRLLCSTSIRLYKVDECS